MTGMKINYDKSDLLTIGTDEERVNEFARIFCCKTGEFPLKYLGVPLHFTKLRIEDLQPIIDMSTEYHRQSSEGYPTKVH